MEIQAAFSSNDINQDDEVDKIDLRNLLWVYEKNKPSDYRAE